MRSYTVAGTRSVFIWRFWFLALYILHRLGLELHHGMGNVNRVIGNTASSIYLAGTTLQSTIVVLEYTFTH